jgi:HAD superfamily hydrolase (TIGR01509 family)
MIKLVIFDLDGVLITTKDLHYNALNSALPDKYAITRGEHLSKYDGLKTTAKLNMLTKEKGLPVELHELIWKEKQSLTLEMLATTKPNPELVALFKMLKDDGYTIAICSNSIRKTLLTILSRLELIYDVDLIISNEDVKNSKPHPEMFWCAMSSYSCIPEDTLIIEDSPHGLLAAARSNAHVMRVGNPNDVTRNNVNRELNKVNNMHKQIPQWKDDKLNVLIPMAGAGSRFERAGYTFPKPLIDVDHKPMIQLVVENLNIDANYIYIVRAEHRKMYNLDVLLNLITPNCTILEVDTITEGAACTALIAKDLINNNRPLFFANSDQFIEWDSNDFFYKMNESDADGGILTFHSTHPKWSFAKVNDNGFVTRVAEKETISDMATVGCYYWKNGSDFVKFAENMINKDVRVNGEFYVCPVYNEAIADGLKIRTHHIDKMWGLGTPEDLNDFIQNGPLNEKK